MRIQAIDRVDCNEYLLASQSSIQNLLGMVLLTTVLQLTSKFRCSPIIASKFVNNEQITFLQESLYYFTIYWVIIVKKNLFAPFRCMVWGDSQHWWVLSWLWLDLPHSDIAPDGQSRVRSPEPVFMPSMVRLSSSPSYILYWVARCLSALGCSCCSSRVETYMFWIVCTSCLSNKDLCNIEVNGCGGRS